MLSVEVQHPLAPSLRRRAFSQRKLHEVLQTVLPDVSREVSQEVSKKATTFFAKMGSSIYQKSQIFDFLRNRHFEDELDYLAYQSILEVYWNDTNSSKSLSFV